jgi:hypothetical protein
MRSATALAVALVAGVCLPATAWSNHLHSVQTGTGACVVLAQNGGERYVTLPAASFQNTTEPTPTANPHPLHVHVHRGAAGDPLDIGVYGTATDPCVASGDYVNVQP